MLQLSVPAIQITLRGNPGVHTSLKTIAKLANSKAQNQYSTHYFLMLS